MKKDTDKNYQYLIRTYSLVDDYLADISNKKEGLPEVIVAFCVVVEKFLKIKLYKENPVLVYDNARFKEDDALVAVIKNKVSNMETIRIGDALRRYKLIFSEDFSEDEIQVFTDIYNLRNHFVHGYESDEFALSDQDNIIKKMGTVWEKISVQVISLFGKTVIKANKPKKKYTEKELEKVLEDEVRKMIQPLKGDGLINPFAYSIGGDLGPRNFPSFSSVASFTTGEKCPRCGQYSLSVGGDMGKMRTFSGLLTTKSVFGGLAQENRSDLYKCDNCHLELTEKQYEIAKKIV